MSLRLATVVVCVLGLSGPSQAAKRLSPKTERQAGKLYEAGLRHYNVADYANAIEEFKHAYLLSEAPELLYNIAQSYRLSKPPSCSQALQFYRSYLRGAPTSSRRAGVEAAVADMDKCVRALVVAQNEAAAKAEEDSKAASEAPLLAPTLVVETPSRPQRILLPVLLGTGGLLVAVAGSALLIWSKVEYDSISGSACAPSCNPSRVDGPKAGQTAGGVLLGLGVAVAASGLIVGIVGNRSRHPSAYLAPTLGGMVAGGEF